MVQGTMKEPSETTMKRLRLGFIGAGFVARFHAIALKQIRGMIRRQLKSMAGPDKE